MNYGQSYANYSNNISERKFKISQNSHSQFWAQTYTSVFFYVNLKHEILSRKQGSNARQTNFILE